MVVTAQRRETADSLIKNQSAPGRMWWSVKSAVCPRSTLVQRYRPESPRTAPKAVTVRKASYDTKHSDRAEGFAP